MSVFLIVIDFIGLYSCSLCFFFFKQKTAYEMRISDWSSDVCSSDLLSGALVAGLRAGLVCNTWPSMNGSFAPPELFDLSTSWLNAFEHIPAVQFAPRLMAYLKNATALGFWLWSRRFALFPRARQGGRAPWRESGATQVLHMEAA